MKKFKNIISALGLSFSKEMTKFIGINILFISAFFLIFYFKLANYYYIILAIIILIIDYVFINSYFSRYQNSKYLHDDELISLFSYFQIFISNHIPVYTAFTNLLTYSSDWMKEKINRLLKEIDNDKSVQPFIAFSKNFDNLVFESLCVSIYQMIDEGEKVETNNQFTFLFKEVEQSHIRMKQDKKRRGLDILTSLPLFGSGIITITLTLAIVANIGGMISVF